MAARGTSSSLRNVSSGLEAVQSKQRQDVVRSTFSRFNARNYHFKTFKSKGAVVVLL